MIKVQVCKCIQPFNSFFEEEKYYLLYPSKSNGELTAYISPTQGFAIVPRGFVRTSVDFYRIYFEPIGNMFVRNYKEIKVLKNKSIEEILQLMQSGSASKIND